MTVVTAHTSPLGPAKLSTRLAFFAAGFAIACWAPLVPYAKANVGASESQFGLLLLCLGIGSVLAMPVTGVLSTRIGARPIVIASGLILGAILPFLAVAGSLWALGAVLLILGAALGSLDVSMNIHGAEVEKRAAVPLMSGFHALFSLGGFVGAGGMTLVLWAGLGPRAAAVLGGAVTLMAIALAMPGLLRRAQGEESPAFVLPHGIVLLIALLAAVAFLTEGALLDWGALLMIDLGLMAKATAGAGFMVFSVTMTIGRLLGDRVVAALGGYKVLFGGGVIAILGLMMLVLAPSAAVALVGFGLIGVGASNIVPVLFSLAGRQTIMPPGLAVAAVTTTGYAGILVAPAAIGFVAEASSLALAFWMLIALMALFPLTARAAMRAVE